MLTPDNAKDIAADLVARALRYGADGGDAVYSGGASMQVQVRLGALEDVENSEGEDVSLRVFVGSKSASSSTSDLSPRALDALAERCVAMAGQAPDDPFAGLADTVLLMQSASPELDAIDDTRLTPEAMRELALACEDAARAVAGVTNSEGAGASQSRSTFALATSHGFARGHQGTGYGVSASVLAGEGSAMQRDSDHHSARHFADVENPAAIGRSAGERAVARMNPVKIKSGPMPVLFDRRVSTSLIGHLAGAMSGSAVARKTSFLLDFLHKRVFGANIDVIDDPLLARGTRSRPFDGEGLPTRRTHLIEGGVLTGWLIDSASGRQLGMTPTGHAVRSGAGSPGTGTTNLHMVAGTDSREALMAGISEGVYVNDLIGMGVNALTGDYSRGASGFMIRDGALAEPVAEITIAGNLKDMFAALIPADDLIFRNAVNAPTVRIDGMTVAGD